MPMIILACPHCGFSREMAAESIPPGVKGATCPECRKRFDLSDAVRPAEPVPLSEPLPIVVSQPQEPSYSYSLPPVDVKPQPRMVKFSFTGTAKDYFGIWIVNTFLKIVTLGFYTAWAKVRKRRYFYGNTFLNNASFDYLADPKILFRGWLVAALFFLLYSVGSKTSPVLAQVLGLLFFFALPWLVVRSRIFNLRNSEHRNICFSFKPSYREAYEVFAGLPFLLPFTLGLIFPYMIYRQKKFFVENSGYGRTGYTFDASVMDYYKVFGRAALWFAILILGFLAGTYFLSATAREFSPLLMQGKSDLDMKTIQKGLAVMVFIVIIGFNLLYMFFAVYVQTELANLTWNGTRIKHSRFTSTLKVREMAWLYLSSGVAILFSLGLLIPWATVRITRYKMENLSLQLCDDMEGFLGWGRRGIGAAGEEIGDMFGIDIGL